MKKILLIFLTTIFAAMLMSGNAQQTKTVQNQTEVKKRVIPGEQAPPANPGQRNFGGMRPPTGSGNQAPQTRSPRPEPTIQTVSLDELSMSDPFIYPDAATHTYYLQLKFII
jgi:hypothetical protein